MTQFRDAGDPTVASRSTDRPRLVRPRSRQRGRLLERPCRPHVRPAFLAGRAGEESLIGFASADTTIVIASCVSAIGAARRADWAWVAMLVATATWAYPAIYSLSMAVTGHGGELSALVMLPTALLNLALTVAYRHRAIHIDGRLAQPSSAGWNVVKTLIELLILWTAFVWLLPALVDRVELAAGWSVVVPDPSRVLGFGLLGAGTVLLVWSALFMAVRGQGTPFPFDAPRRLVIEGPYRYVRNPQVIGGLLQGISLVLFAYADVLDAAAENPARIWPPRFVPIADFSGIYVCVDCTTDAGRIVDFDFKKLDYEGRDGDWSSAFTERAASLHKWLEEWVEGPTLVGAGQ